MINKLRLHLDSIKNSKCIKSTTIKFLYKYNINTYNSHFIYKLSGSNRPD